MSEAARLDPKRILVIKLADLGDLLTATPALRALRNRYPNAEISALATPHSAPLLEGNDAVDHVIGFPKALYDRPAELLRPVTGLAAGIRAAALAWRLRSEHFDAVVLLHHLFSGWGLAKYRALLTATGAPVRIGLDQGPGTFLTESVPDRGFGERHEVDYWLDVVGLLGAEMPDPRMELHLSADETEEADRRWSELALDPNLTVVLHPGSGAFSKARRWGPERYATVGDALAAEGLGVMINVGPGEEAVAAAMADAMEARPRLLGGLNSPRQLAGVLRRARLFIGNDSGVMHLAATMGVPTVAVFGLTNHRAWGPYPPAEHRVVRLDLPCSPCFYRGHLMGTPEGCPPRMCLTELGPEAVLSAARDLLARTRIQMSSA